MLESLRVKNLALIDETEVCFTKGLNIITGETGAGKSLVIGSIQLALGARGDKTLIRKGADYALVELVFSVTEEETQKLEALEIYPEEGVVSLQRRIMPAKSVCRINGEMVGGQSLKEAAGILIDMHGQHDSQFLLKKQKHLEFLDDYCGDEIEGIGDSVKSCYESYKKLQRELDEAEELEGNKDKEISLAQFECKEIEEAAIIPGEDEELEKKYRRMLNARKIGEAVHNAHTLIGGLDFENAYSLTDKALKELHTATMFDDSLSNLIDNLQNASELLKETSHELGRYLDGMDFSEAEYVQTENRLNILNHLKDKYGNSLEAVLEYQSKQEEMLQKLQDLASYRERLKEDVTKQKIKLLKEAAKLSKIRKKNAEILKEEMKKALIDLNFLMVDFDVRVMSDEDKVSAMGYDDVEFLISLNPGEALKPIAGVASGGELSRIMLALKTVLAKQDHVGTLVFDEIDAGISGKTAWKVSEKLAVLGREHQVICITHLPQIAAMADTHFLITKSATQQVTTTDLKALERDEMVNELARLLGGEELTDAVKNNAIELKKMADDTKQY